MVPSSGDAHHEVRPHEDYTTRRKIEALTCSYGYQMNLLGYKIIINTNNAGFTIKFRLIWSQILVIDRQGVLTIRRTCEDFAASASKHQKKYV